MTLSNFIRHYRRAARERIGTVRRNPSYLFELLLFLLLVLLVILGIVWM